MNGFVVSDKTTTWKKQYSWGWKVFNILTNFGNLWKPCPFFHILLYTRNIWKCSPIPKWQKLLDYLLILAFFWSFLDSSITFLGELLWTLIPILQFFSQKSAIIYQQFYEVFVILLNPWLNPWGFLSYKTMLSRF